MINTDTGRGSLAETANWLAVVVIALLLLGVVMVYSASARPEVELNWGEFWKYTSLRQVFFVPVAMLVMLLSSYWPVRWWRIERYGLSLSTLLVAVTLAALVLVLIPGIGVEVDEDRLSAYL